MTLNSIVFDTVKPWLDPKGFTGPRIRELDDALMRYLAAAKGSPAAPPPAPSAPTCRITPKVALELISHEAIVQEAYRDSVGVWTWGVGVTDRSGHSVKRYVDKPQPIAKCLAVYLWLLRERYLPTVLEEFDGHPLTEEQLAAALSFHYNTGAIASASWVDQWKAGKIDQARSGIMEWKHPKEIIERRGKERDLFFDGKWSQDGKALIIPVSKPSYQPNFRGARRVDITADLAAALAEAV